MTVQIDSLAIGTADANKTETEVDIDQLFEQVTTIDAEILDAVERRTQLARTLAAVTNDATPSDDAVTPYADLGSDGHVFSRLLARLAEAVR